MKMPKKFITILGGNAPNLTPVDLIYDSFIKADGNLGTTSVTGPSGEICNSYTWVSNAAYILSNKAIITPSLTGDEILVNGGMETFTDGLADNWTKTGTPTTIQEATIVYEGSSSQKYVSSSNSESIFQVPSLTTGRWYRSSVRNYVTTGTCSVIMKATGGANLINQAWSSASWGEAYTTYLCRGVGYDIVLRDYLSSPVVAYFDAASVKQITLNDMIATIDTDVISATHSVAITKGTSTDWFYGGLAICLNSQTAPTAGIFLVYGGNSIDLYKFTTATTWTLIESYYLGNNYGAGRVLKAVVTQATGRIRITVYYNNSLVIATKDITDASIISNTIHGICASDSKAQFSNYTLDWRSP